MNIGDFKKLFLGLIGFQENAYHPLVWIKGDVLMGKEVYVGFYSEIHASGAQIKIGDHCDIASFVSINCVDSHKKCLGLTAEPVRKNICLEENVFIGSHSVVKGGAHIGHHSVIAAGTIVDGVHIPPYSLVSGNPMQIKEGYYRPQLVKK